MSDIFVVLPPATSEGCVVFGKNSDRPPSEVQEVIYLEAADHPTDAKLQCTYTEVEPSHHTHAMMLSKAAWTWGADMGANQYGVCIGNTSIWNKMCKLNVDKKGLLGVDIVRLGLQGSNTAKEALDVMCKLVETHGQSAGTCEDPAFRDWSYSNGFLLADRTEAWVLETVSNHWAAQRITSGTRNLSSCHTIGTQIDIMSDGLTEFAQSKNLWQPGDGEFDFSKVFSDDSTVIEYSESEKPENRYSNGKQLLHNLSEKGNFQLEDMMSILRDENSSINMHGSLLTTGSQISILTPANSITPCCHWFTATPDPQLSIFKPFMFCPNVNIGNSTVSPTSGFRSGCQVTANQRSELTTNHSHVLYEFHEKGRELMKQGGDLGRNLLSTMRDLEKSCVEDVKEFLDEFSEEKYDEVEELFKDIAESECKFYK